MVTNLPAEARAKWLKVMDAKTPEEKLKALQEFLSAVPKHKGTENLVYWAKRRMAELREELETSKRKSGSSISYYIEKEGAGQVLLLGDVEMKNELMRKLTNVKSDPKEYPVPGMMEYEDVKIQLVNPPILIGGKLNSRILGLARNADVILFVVKDRNEYEDIRKYLEDNGILIGKPKGKVIIERSRYGIAGIRIVNIGKLINTSENEIRKYIESFGIKSCMIKIIGEVTLDDVEKALFESVTYKQGLIVTRNLFEAEKIQVLRFDDLENIKKTIFDLLEIIRVYTKEPLEEPSKDPLILKKGSTVLDVARKLHSELAEKLKYARVWGKSVKFQGQRVGPDHVLEDGDIVELHVK
ncbi:MAG: TGS domain-containing protein [Sulfolobaceae archaeon]